MLWQPRGVTHGRQVRAQAIQEREVFFTLHAENGQTILTSEMYESKPSAVNGIESVKKNAATDLRYGRLVGKDGSPYFTLKAGNGQVIGSSQMYSSTAARDAGIESCKTNAPGASVTDNT